MGREGNEEESIGKAKRFGGAAHEQNTYSARPLTSAAGLPGNYICTACTALFGAHLNANSRRLIGSVLLRPHVPAAVPTEGVLRIRDGVHDGMSNEAGTTIAMLKCSHLYMTSSSFIFACAGLVFQTIP